MSSAVLVSSSSDSPVSRSPSPVASGAAAAPRAEALTLVPGQAMSLRAGRAGVLRVTRGRLWATRDATRSPASSDSVSPGPSTRSSVARRRVVMEAWDGRGADCAWTVASPVALSR
jgi:hypothetical protein